MPRLGSRVRVPFFALRLPEWWNGRHEGLKILWLLQLWGFKSPFGYCIRLLILRLTAFFILNTKNVHPAKTAQSIINGDCSCLSSSPLPCPVALRGFTYKIGTETKREYVSTSPPVFCAAKYRGSARRARGLIYTIKYCFATQRRRLNTFYLTGKNHTTKESRNTPCLTLRTAKD